MDLLLPSREPVPAAKRHEVVDEEQPVDRRQHLHLARHPRPLRRRPSGPATTLILHTAGDAIDAGLDPRVTRRREGPGTGTF